MLHCCNGLYYLHNKNIVHRDLKPQNFVLDENNIAKVCDFGTALILQNKDERLKGTEGTFHFMAPESLKENNEKSGFSGV